MRRGRTTLALFGLAAVAACGSTVPASQIAAQASGRTGDSGLGGGSGVVPSTTGGAQPTYPSGFGAGGTGSTGGTTGSTSTSGLSGGAANGASGSGTELTSPGGLASGPSGSAVGVDAKTIKIGVLTAQGFSGFVKAAGASISTGDMKAQATAVVNYLNAHGGMAGRRIVPVFHDVDVSQTATNKPAAEQAACSAFTQDNHVYAVVSPVAFQDDTLYACLAKAGTLVSDAGETFDATFYSQHPDTFYMPADMSMTRVLSTNIDALFAQGFFGGWSTVTGAPGKAPVKVGLIRKDTASDARVRDQAVKPALARHGLTLVDDIAISPNDATGSGYSSAALRFASDGITHVLVTSNGPALFMQQAEQQGYHPRYGLNSRSSPAAILEGTAPAGQLGGAMGIGWQQYNDVSAQKDPGPPSARGRLCLQLMKKAGEDLTSRSTLLTANWYCDTIFFLHDALSKAPAFSLRGFRAGAESLTSYEAAGTFRSGFAPGLLHDGVRGYRLFAYQSSCGCFAYTTPVKAVS